MRRSTRARKPAAIVNIGDDTMGSDIESEEPPLKKQKTSSSSRKAKSSKTTAESKVVQRKAKCRVQQGALKNFAHMPLEILYEIAWNLTPQDLIFLSRTTKTLRRSLLNRSSGRVWREAISNVDGLPECPPSFSEPFYLALLLDSHCLAPGCFAKSSQICWDFGTRWCQSCALGNKSLGLVRRSKLRKFELEQREVLNLCPQTEVTRAGDTILLFPEDLLRNKLIPEFRKMNQTKKEEWIKKQSAEMKLIREHAVKCEKWIRNREDELFQKTNIVRQERVREILKRLTDLGWEHEIIRCQLHRHRLVSQAKKLTENTWIKIYPQIVEDIKVMERELLEKWYPKGAVLQRNDTYYASEQAIRTETPTI